MQNIEDLCRWDYQNVFFITTEVEDSLCKLELEFQFLVSKSVRRRCLFKYSTEHFLKRCLFIFHLVENQILNFTFLQNTLENKDRSSSGWRVCAQTLNFFSLKRKRKIFQEFYRKLHLRFTIWFGLKAVYNYIFSYIFSVFMTNFNSNCPPLSCSPVSIVHKLLKKKHWKDLNKNQKLPHVSYCTILKFKNLL